MTHAEAHLSAAQAAPALAPSLAADAPEDLRPFIDGQRRMLDELAELGLRATRAVVAQAESDAPPPASEIALAYARVSRAVRLCIMLHGKLLDAREDEGEIQEMFTPAYRKKARVEKIVERIAEAEAEDEEACDAIIIEAGERLDDEDLYGDLMERPMSEIVERLCKDLDLSPDWSELSQELWARREAASITSSSAGAWRGESDRQRRSIERPLAEHSEGSAVEGDGQAHDPLSLVLTDSS